MKFSIVTVCLNSAKTIRQTIESVIYQKYENIEYIIIDGGSTDGTVDIIKEYGDRITYWVSEKDNGLYDAMNKGISRATGDVISLLNSDDWYEPDILGKVKEYFETYKVDMVCGSIRNILDNEEVGLTTSRYDLEKLHLRVQCMPPALFCKRCVYEQIGLFNTEFKITADFEWEMKAWQKRISCYNATDIFTNFRLTGTSGQQKYLAMQENYEIARRYLPQFQTEVDAFYSDRLESCFYEQSFTEQFENMDKNLLCKLFTDKQFYIWGTGIQGAMCLHTMENLELQCIGFVDNDKRKWNSKIKGYQIYEPDKLDKNMKICIAAREYNEEIKAQLKGAGYTSNRYVEFSEIMKQAVIRTTGIRYESFKDNRVERLNI